jgi:hypothetical protein
VEVRNGIRRGSGIENLKVIEMKGGKRSRKGSGKSK